MSRSNRRPRSADGLRCVAATAALLVICLAPGVRLEAQDALPDSGAAALTAPPAGGLPLFLTLGVGYGQRVDPCAFCTSVRNTQAFTGHLSLGKYVAPSVGLGVDASIWRRRHPGLPGPVDSLGVATPTTLVNQLGNVSMSLSLEVWQIWARGGVGLAMGRQDIQDTNGRVAIASGIGVGYSVGGGIGIPLASMASLAVFVNWNVGKYDLNTPSAVIGRGVEHKYVEIGFGLTLR